MDFRWPGEFAARRLAPVFIAITTMKMNGTTKMKADTMMAAPPTRYLRSFTGPPSCD